MLSFNALKQTVHQQTPSLRLPIGARTLALYVLLGAGGLWHLLGLFQTTMRLLAGPLIILLGIWVSAEYYSTLPPGKRNGMLVWCAGVVVGSFLLEWFGVTTGVLFGQYAYGQVLQPQLFSVPVAIGFAWLTMLLASHSMAKSLIGAGRRGSRFLLPVLGAVFMVGFDLLLEPAVQQLGYWRWAGGSVPLQNYLVWFGASLILLTAGQIIRIFPERTVRFGTHVYLAQMLYFGLVLI